MSITNSSKESEKENKLWGSIIRIGHKGYKGPFRHFVILIVSGCIIAAISYFGYSYFIKASPSNPIVEQENIEIEQPKAEANKDSEASESEQITLTDSEEVEEQYKAGDTFKDCDDCPDMVVVPAGEFYMGSPQKEENRNDDEGPVHIVTISEPFVVSQYEITRIQFQKFVAETKHSTDDQGCNWLDPPGFEQNEDHPVVCISWNDAKAYIDWLSQETDQTYRLLSEAEWEYVARAGTTTAYHFGDTISKSQANYDYDGRRWSEDGGTVEVGSYPANAFGLHDVHGNVWEWVEDCYHNNYTGAPADGSAWVSDCDYDHLDLRVLRGGSWNLIPRDLRSAYRSRLVARLRGNYIGFRVARTLNH